MALKYKWLTMLEVAQLVKDATFVGQNAVTAIAVIWAESGGNAWAININGVEGSLTYGSIDIGICQFNTYWWSTHKANDLMKPAYSINLMYKASKGFEFKYWSAFVYKHHQKYMAYAQAVAHEVGILDT